MPKTKTLTLRVPESLMDEADDLRDQLADSPKNSHRLGLTRSDVLRMALSQGFAALRGEKPAGAEG